MKYFNNIETITYDQLYSVKNIFARIILDYVSKDIVGYINLDQYRDPRLYMISNDLYGTPEYWWILSLLNNKYDIIYDMPLPLEILEAAAVGDGTLDAQTISDRYDELLSESTDKSKRYLKVIKPAYLNSVLVEIIQQLRSAK